MVSYSGSDAMPARPRIGRVLCCLLFALLSAASQLSAQEEVAAPALAGNTAAADANDVESATAVPEAPAVAAPAAESLHFKQSDFDLGDTLGDIVLYLALLCAVAAVAIFLLRQRLVARGALPEKPGAHIRTLDRQAVSTRTTLHLLDVDGRRVMLAESASGQTLIELSPGERADD